MKKLSIICPVFNEEDVIKIFYDELKKTLNKLRKSYKSNIIFVLDKSSDNSFLKLFVNYSMGYAFSL